MEAGGAAIRVRRRLAVFGVPGGDDELEVTFEAGPAQDRLNLVAERARRNPQRQRRAQPLDAAPPRDRARRSASRIASMTAVFAPPSGQCPARSSFQSARLAQRPQRGHVVEPDVLLVVLVALEREPVLAEHRLIRAQVQRLGIGEHAVEIEDDGADRCRPVGASARRLDRAPAAGSRAAESGTRSRVEDAERVIGPVEIEIVEPRRRAIEIEIASALVGLGAVGEIAERHEQPLIVGSSASANAVRVSGCP